MGAALSSPSTASPPADRALLGSSSNLTADRASPRGPRHPGGRRGAGVAHPLGARRWRLGGAGPGAPARSAASARSRRRCERRRGGGASPDGPSPSPPRAPGAPRGAGAFCGADLLSDSVMSAPSRPPAPPHTGPCAPSAPRRQRRGPGTATAPLRSGVSLSVVGVENFLFLLEARQCSKTSRGLVAWFEHWGEA